MEKGWGWVKEFGLPYNDRKTNKYNITMVRGWSSVALYPLETQKMEMIFFVPSLLYRKDLL